MNETIESKVRKILTLDGVTFSILCTNKFILLKLLTILILLSQYRQVYFNTVVVIIPPIKMDHKSLKFNQLIKDPVY